MAMQTLTQGLLLITMLSNVVLGVLVYRNNSGALLNRLFLAFAVNTSLWALSVFMVSSLEAHGALLLWMRISHAVAAFTPFFTIAMVYSFQETGQYPKKWIFSFFFFTFVLALLTLLTPAVIRDLGLPLEARAKINGPLFPLYFTFFAGVSIWSVLLLLRKIASSQGLVRYQMRYFLGGILISFLLGSTVNLLLPLLGIATVGLRNLGPVFTNLAVISITYAVLRYRLMNLQMALRNLLIYALTSVLLGIAFFLPLLYLVFQPGFPSTISLLLIVFLAMLISYFFHPAREWIRSALVDRYLYRETTNYFRILQETSRAILSILNMDSLLNYLLRRIVDTARIQQGVFYLRQGMEGPFEPMAVRILPSAPDRLHPRPLSEDNPLLHYLENHENLLLCSDLRGKLSSREQAVKEILQNMEVEAAVPVRMDGKMQGIFLLGAKGSGEPYSPEDVNLLLALSSQLAVALKNAQFHREVAGMKQYLENVLENMGNGLLTVDGSGRIITFNGAAERFSGLDGPEVLGRPAEEVLNPDLALFIQQTLQQKQGLDEVEFAVPTGDGSWRHLTCSTALVELPDNGHGAILVMSDITWQKQLEEEKNRAERLASLGELAAGMAHEIKNPLVSIKTFAELLPERFDEQDFRYNFSQVVGQEIERINDLLNRLLGFARDSQQFLEDIDLGCLLEEIFLLLSPQLEAQQIRLEKNFQLHLAPVRADRNQLKQALFNICQNAVEAMNKGGLLRIQAERLPDSAENHGLPGRPAESFAHSGAGLIKLLVQDSGEGIPRHKQQKVFNPFYTTKATGVGIGLSISHRIISSCGGTIKLQSAEGKGTTFEILLPSGQELEYLPEEALLSEQLPGKRDESA